MASLALTTRRSAQRGQTLIIALIVLGVLLILGLVFLGIVNRGLTGSARAQRRSVANDLAEAGVRYAHGQLLNSELGADWRGTPTPPIPVSNNPTDQDYNDTRDPDAYYLRPGSGVPLRAASPEMDLGGPDGLGPFIRINFNNGRALVRVRYAPSDANILSANPTGSLRKPGTARNYLIIESLGRQGVVNSSDPTTLLAKNEVTFRGLTSTGQLQTTQELLRRYDSQFPNSRRLIAFAGIGIIDSARYITNLYRVTRPIEIGIPEGLGAQFNGTVVGNNLPYQLGTGGTINGGTAVPRGFGTVIANGDVVFHGKNVVYLNSLLGDRLSIAGSVSTANSGSLQINRVDYDKATGTWATTTGTLAGNQLDSRNPNFSTANGLLLDGLARTDNNGFARGVGRLEPPSILTIDAETKENRYVSMTRESGQSVNGTNSGRYGHGRGVYVDNTTDRQEPLDEQGRAIAGTEESLINDWLNPNNGDTNSGWRGGFYVPRGTSMQLLQDGFVLQRGDQPFYDDLGVQTSRRTVRYRIGWVTRGNGERGQLYIVDNLTHQRGSTINYVDTDATTGNINFARDGRPFNGVLYFEGNVRIRGVIPTDVQLTLVSNATIYIEGSILKGIRGNDVTQMYSSDPTISLLAVAYDGPLDRPSRSTLMLMARDHVAVNTTQFFGTLPGQDLAEVNDQAASAGYNAVRMPATGGLLQLSTEIAMDSENATNPYNPTTYRPYNLDYVDAVATNVPIPTSLLLTHATDDGAAPASLISLNINYGSNESPDLLNTPSAYQFPGAGSGVVYPGSTSLLYFGGLTNTASLYLNNGQPASIPVYGLGSESWQRYNKFETRGFMLIDPANTSLTNGVMSNNSPNVEPFIKFRLFAQGGNDFRFRPNQANGVATNDYLLARAAMAPNDIRIEASVYAQQGSFFIIPGPWFNPNPSDTRDAYLTGTLTIPERDQRRLSSFGTAPEVPFYGEPLDVRVVVVGSVSENMPPPMSQQSEWVRKWGWIPSELGAVRNPSNAANPLHIPASHVPAGTNLTATPFVPNLIVQYDPALATARATGFDLTNNPGTLIRSDEEGRALPPMPRLPVSPLLSYFGEIQ